MICFVLVDGKLVKNSSLHGGSGTRGMKIVLDSLSVLGIVGATNHHLKAILIILLQIIFLRQKGLPKRF